MEGHRRLLSELDTEQLFSKLVSEDKLIAKGAKYLYENDIDGACFVEMEDEEFGEVNGLTFGIRKALIRFRKKVLQQEQDSTDMPILDNGPGSTPLSEECKEEETKGIAGAATQREFKCMVTIKEWTLGQFSEGIDSAADIFNQPLPIETESTDLFGQPLPKKTDSGLFGKPLPRHTEIDGEGSDLFGQPLQKKTDSIYLIGKPLPIHTEIDGEVTVEDSVSLASANTPMESSQIERSCMIDCRPSKAVEKSREGGAPSCRVQYVESFPTSKSLTNKSLVKQRKLPNFELNSIVKWQEQGKPRSACQFMKLREEEIVLEGFVQKLAGVNSRLMMNHWTSRYAIILKSGVFINFDFHREKLFPKGAIDLTTVERVQIPQTSTGGSSLRLEIFTTKKRLMLGFSTEAEMLMWQNEVLGIKNRDQGDDEDEKSS